MGRHRKPALHLAFIVERIRQTPQLTLHALKDEIAARGMKVSQNAVWTFFRVKGCASKERCSLPSRDTLTPRGDRSADAGCSKASI
jgi:putative transposase